MNRLALVRRRIIIVIGLVLTSFAAFADEPKDEGLHIAPQPLSTALREFSEQTGFQLGYASELAEGKSTDGVEGIDDPELALDMLLAQSGLTHTFVNEQTVVIQATEIPSSDDAGGDRDLGNRTAAGATPIVMAQYQTGVQQSQASQANERESAREKRPIEEIVVTGTNIRGIAPESSPFFVFDREAINQTGVGSIQEFIQLLPQNFGGGSNADVVSLPNDRLSAENYTAGSSVNLRGLGSGSTLVLLNGRRLASAGNQGDFVDISLIPLSAVDRVEVLTDGASAIYGADAIAGVVNFVLRDDYDGAESFVRFGSVTEGDLSEYRVGQAFGKNWNTGNALVSYEFYHRDNLKAGDRDFASDVLLPRDLLPRQQNHSVMMSGRQEIGERMTLRANGVFADRDSQNVFNNGAGFLTRDSNTQQYGGSIGAEVKLWSNWLLDVAGGYHKLEAFTESETAIFFGQTATDSELWSIEGKMDGTLLQLPGGNVRLALGTGYREEIFLNSRVDLDLTNSSSDRSVFAAYGEAFIPIVGSDNRRPGIERLELTAAGRFEDFSDFGTTANPKVGILWSPLEGFNFRGSYSTSFNPPNLGDIGETGGFSLVFNLPDPNSPTGSTLALFDGRTNPELKPEEARTWTAGIDYRNEIGRGDLNVSMTWFDIDFRDRIDVGTNDFLAILPNPEIFADIITFDPDPALSAEVIAEVFFTNAAPGLWSMPGDEEVLLDVRLVNLASVDTSGIDLNATYAVDSELGIFNFGVNGSYLFNQERRITSAAPAVDLVDTVFNPVDLRVRGNASWSHDGIDAAIFINYVDDYVDDRDITAMGDLPISSWTTVDLNLSFDTGEYPEDRLLQNTKFSLSVINLFDQAPPKVGSLTAFSAGFDPTNAGPLGRFIAFQITKAW